MSRRQIKNTAARRLQPDAQNDNACWVGKPYRHIEQLLAEVEDCEINELTSVGHTASFDRRAAFL